MAEWSIAHAWKSDRFTRADAHQILPTHVRSISSRCNEVLRDAPVSEDVHRGFRGVCDTVLTQFRWPLSQTITDTYKHALSHTALSGRQQLDERIDETLVSAETIVHAHRLCGQSARFSQADLIQVRYGE